MKCKDDENSCFWKFISGGKECPSTEIIDALDRYDAEILVCEDFYRFLNTVMNIHPRHIGLISDRRFEADMALSIGGDGTFLKTAERVGDKNIPIIGINTGRLGFWLISLKMK